MNAAPDHLPAARPVAVDASGNALGAFKAGQTVQFRTRTTNANGARTSRERTFTLEAPVK